MRAVVVAPSKRHGFDFADVDEPDLANDQVLVSVKCIALNRGDLNDARSGRLSEGEVLQRSLRSKAILDVNDSTAPNVTDRADEFWRRPTSDFG